MSNSDFMARCLISAMNNDINDISTDLMSLLQEDLKNIKYRRTLTSTDNINEITENGYFDIGASQSSRPTGDYPSGYEGQRITFFSFTKGNRLCQEMINAQGNLTIRMFAGGVWNDWQIMATTSDTQSFEYKNIANTSTTANKGVEITVLSYNVGVYNNGNTSLKGMDSSIIDEKIFNIKKFIMNVNPLLMGLQEDTAYVDRELTKDAHEYLYKPILPNRSTLGGSSVYSKYNFTKSGSRPIGNNRYMAWCEISINNKTLLFISAHPSPDTIEHRNSEYENIFNWISGRTYNWCIVAGDFNTIDEQDRTNLANLCETNGFSMANGGYLGWVKTTPTHRSLDNILVKNCIINSVKVYNSKADELWSDHYPISAKITLLD